MHISALAAARRDVRTCKPKTLATKKNRYLNKGHSQKKKDTRPTTFAKVSILIPTTPQNHKARGIIRKKKIT